MINTGIEPLQISDTERVSFYYDTAHITVDEVIGDDVGVFTLDTARGYNAIEQGEFTAELRRLLGNAQDYGWSGEQLERAISQYLSMAGCTFRQVSLRGHSQGEWAEVVVYTKDDFDISVVVPSLKAWFAGDVYVMARETLEIYTNLKNGDLIERWEGEDFLGCVIGDTIESLYQQAKEYWADLGTVAMQ
jgi:hypothetical protein